MFKSICDSYALSVSEFSKIFPAATHTEFNIWDTDRNSLIDALELFTGLIIFGDARTEDKIRFLFDLYDFNEVQSISKIDLE